jgi:hypothetical protein
MMKKLVASTALAIALAAPGAATLAIGGAAQAAPAVVDVHACTHTSTGSCIRGGGFCPQASYGKSGYSATGKRYVCKGDRVHPHWMIP